MPRPLAINPKHPGQRGHPREIVERICDIRERNPALGPWSIARLVKLKPSQVQGILWRKGFYGAEASL